MPKKLHSMIILMLCLPVITEAQHTQDPQSNVRVIVYPREIYFGDPIYLGIYLKNVSEEVETMITDYKERNDFWLTLHSESISVPYYLLYESDLSWNPWPSKERRIFEFSRHTFQPGESMRVSVDYLELPALEDMNVPFWKEAKKRLNAGESIVAQITGEWPQYDASGRNITQPEKPNIRFVSDPIVIKPRPGPEMELLEKWLEETPKKLLPVPLDQFNAESSVSYFFAWIDLKDEFDTVSFTPKPDFVSKTVSVPASASSVDSACTRYKRSSDQNAEKKR